MTAPAAMTSTLSVPGPSGFVRSKNTVPSRTLCVALKPWLWASPAKESEPPRAKPSRQKVRNALKRVRGRELRWSKFAAAIIFDGIRTCRAIGPRCERARPVLSHRMNRQLLQIGQPRDCGYRHMPVTARSNCPFSRLRQSRHRRKAAPSFAGAALRRRVPRLLKKAALPIVGAMKRRQPAGVRNPDQACGTRNQSLKLTALHCP